MFYIYSKRLMNRFFYIVLFKFKTAPKLGEFVNYQALSLIFSLILMMKYFDILFSHLSFNIVLPVHKIAVHQSVLSSNVLLNNVKCIC